MARPNELRTTGLVQPDEDSARRASKLFTDDERLPRGVAQDGLKEDFEGRVAQYAKEGIPYTNGENEQVILTTENLVSLMVEDDGLVAEILELTIKGLMATPAIDDYQRYVNHTQERIKEMDPQIRDLVARKNELEMELLDSLRSLHTRGSRETTPSSEGLSPAVRRKALDHPKRLNDGTEPTFDFWKTAMNHKMEKDANDFPLQEDKAAYIISRCEGKAAKQLEPHLRKKTYAKDPDGLMDFLEGLFHDPLQREKAEEDFLKLYMRKDQTFQTFYAKFVQLSAEAEIEDSRLKRELCKRINDDLKKAVARESVDPTVTYQDIKKTLERVAYVNEAIQIRQNTKTQKKVDGHQRSASPPQKKKDQDVAPPKNERLEKLSKEGKCFNCEATGHRFFECPLPRRGLIGCTQAQKEPEADDSENEQS